MRTIVAFLMLSAAVAGCAQSSEGIPEDAPGFQDGTYVLRTTPIEAFELAGTNIVAFEDGRFAYYAEREAGMPKHLVYDGASYHASESLLGWTQYDARGDVPGNRNYRLETWNIAGLVAGAQRYSEGAYHGTIEVKGEAHDYSVAIGEVIRVDGSFEPETPYTLSPVDDDNLPFPFEVPDSVPAATVRQNDAAAFDAHVQIIQWIRAYQEQTGNVPQTVDADTLFLQRLGEPWPENVYDGTDMHNDRASGHFTWRVCSGQDATYAGYGWDLVIQSDSHGRGCTI